MVKHIVFLKLEDNSEQNKQVFKDKIMSMKGKIGVMKHIEVGMNYSNEARAYDLVLINDFQTKEDLQSYAINPIHLKIIEFLKANNTVTKVVDYEY